MELIHQAFEDRSRPHVLMITNHGIHQWRVIPGLPDTGGQNVYVNHFTEALVELGFRVTIANRGGYAHPATEELQVGVHYHPSGHARIVYLEDGDARFVRKEDMHEHLDRLTRDLRKRIDGEDDSFDLIISHYWDAGVLGVQVNKNLSSGKRIAPHVWVPHSLGTIKKRNMDPSTWKSLRIDERIEAEQNLIEHLDGCVATSATIRDAFRDDYGVPTTYFLPPCVNPNRYRPLSLSQCETVWPFLCEHSPLTIDQLKQRKIITEVSRTDKTKRKDVLIRSFAQAKTITPEALLIVTVDDRAPLYQELVALINELGLQRDVIVLGSVWEQLPMLYNISSVFCTPSVMEGFGMSIQEAAACGVPGIASHLVPFACEYLVGSQTTPIAYSPKDPDRTYLMGEGGIVVAADCVDGFAAAMSALLQDDALRSRMGERALAITVPYFTWANRTKDLMVDLGLSPQEEGVEVGHG